MQWVASILHTTSEHGVSTNLWAELSDKLDGRSTILKMEEAGSPETL